MAQFAVVVQITTPDGVLTVLDPGKLEPRFKKFPGGKSEGSETPEECAVREVEEETGISLTIYDLKEVYREQRNGHVFVFFQAEFSEVPPHKAHGDEGEEINITPLEELLPDLFPPHRAILERVAM